jgi:hypothetical protein
VSAWSLHCFSSASPTIHFVVIWKSGIVENTIFLILSVWSSAVWFSTTKSCRLSYCTWANLHHSAQPSAYKNEEPAFPCVMLPEFLACLPHHAWLLPQVLLPGTSPCFIWPSLRRQERQASREGIRQARRRGNKWMDGQASKWTKDRWMDVWINEGRE